MARSRDPKSTWAANLLLAGGTLIACFLALEIGVRWWVDVLDYVPINVKDIDLDFPIRFVPGAQRTYETSEFRYSVQMNRFGRRDVEWSDQTVKDPQHVLFVGDSFVMGNGVEHEHAIPTLLERRFAERGDPREVFNFGMAAGLPNTYLALLEHAIEQDFAARTLLVGIFVGNDFYPEALAEVPLAILPPREAAQPARWRPHSQLVRFLRLRLASSPRMVGWALYLGPRLGIPVYDTTGSYIFLRDPAPDQRELFDRILEYLGRMQDLAREHDRSLRLVVIPNRIQVENHEDLTSRVFDASRPNDRVMEYCAERGISCLDLLPVLSERYETDREPLYFPIDRHLNERGTQLAADAIGAFLEESGALR